MSARGNVLCSGLGSILHKVLPPTGAVCKVTLGGESVNVLKMLEDTFNCFEQGASHLLCSEVPGTQNQDQCLAFCPLIGIPSGADFSGACREAGNEWALLVAEVALGFTKVGEVFTLMIDTFRCLALRLPVLLVKHASLVAVPKKFVPKDVV